MKKETQIIILSIFFGLLVWFSDSVFDYLFFYRGKFLDLLILDVPSHEIYFRTQVIIFFALFGLVISRLFTRRVQAETALRKVRDDLEKSVEERTAKLTEANTFLNDEIIERTLAENRLQQAMEMLQAVFDGIFDPLVLLNKDFKIKMLNKSAIAYYGIDNPEEIVGERCHQTLFGNLDPCEGCANALTNLSSQPSAFERKGIFDPSNTEKVVLYPIKDAAGDVKDLIVRISDVTERKKIERYLVQNEKMASLGILVSSIAHEINNPNSFVAFNVPILKDYIEVMMPIIADHAGNNPDIEFCNMNFEEFRQDIAKILDNIDHGSERISLFVSNLKEYSKVNFERPNTWIELGSVIEKAYSICRNKINKEVKTFAIDKPDNLPEIYTDPFALEQILINLLLNAAQSADKPDSWIKISVKVTNPNKNHVAIEVRDNGVGMDKATMNLVFDPFFTTKSKASGTGLGLYICHNLSRGLGGTIEVESEPGKGSTFRLVLPIGERN
jgi:signal transduction histidine kinase